MQTVNLFFPTYSNLNHRQYLEVVTELRFINFSVNINKLATGTSISITTTGEHEANILREYYELLYITFNNQK